MSKLRLRNSNQLLRYNKNKIMLFLLIGRVISVSCSGFNSLLLFFFFFFSLSLLLFVLRFFIAISSSIQES